MNALLENPAATVSSPARAADRSVLDITDEELMQRIQKQDSAALGILHDRYSGLMKGLIMKVLHDDAASDDLLQEVFIELWNRAGSYSSEKGKPLGWIITLARRRSIDRLRKRDTYCRVEDRFAEQTRNQAHDWVAHVEEDVAQSEMRAFLTRALSTLPVAQREAIEAAYFKGMSQREIAASTGIPLGTIKTRLELGLRKLSEDLHGLEELL